MRDQLLTAWRARRALLVSPPCRISAFMQALLSGLDARPVRIAPDADADRLNRAMTKGRVSALIVPDLCALSPGGSLQSQLGALLSLLSEARESGIPLVILCSCAGVYRAGGKPWAARESDMTGGETAEGLTQSILQMAADGVSRGLMGDPVSVIIARHLPCLGCGHPAVAPYQAWCEAIDADTLVSVPHPALQGVYIHPLDVCCGALALGARYLLGDTQMTGAFNIGADAQNLMANRTAALRFIRQSGGTRPIREIYPPLVPSLPLLDGSRAHFLCGLRTAIPGDEALCMLLELHRACKRGYPAEESVVRKQTQDYIQRLLR